MYFALCTRIATSRALRGRSGDASHQLTRTMQVEREFREAVRLAGYQTAEHVAGYLGGGLPAPPRQARR